MKTNRIEQASNQYMRELRQEDLKFCARDPFPQHQNSDGHPHHMGMPVWAGEKQSEYGAHRRGPTRNWR